MESSNQEYNAVKNGKYRYMLPVGLLLTSVHFLLERYFAGPYTETIGLIMSISGCVILLSFLVLSCRERRSKI